VGDEEGRRREGSRWFCMDEEEAIKRMTRLLEMGGTMLATHHECGAPLFRYKGEVVCPVCSFEEAGAAEIPHQGEGSPAGSPPKGAAGPAGSRRGDTEGIFGGDSEEGGRIREERPRKAEDEGESGRREGLSRGMRAESPMDPALGGVEAAILDKIREISDKIGEEQDMSRLKGQLECLKEALEVLERLRGLGSAFGSDRLG